MANQHPGTPGKGLLLGGDWTSLEFRIWMRGEAYVLRITLDAVCTSEVHPSHNHVHLADPADFYGVVGHFCRDFHSNEMRFDLLGSATG